MSDIMNLINKKLGKDEAQEIIDNKVDKESGKSLSTNDFTDAYKTKLDNYTPITYGTTDLTPGSSSLATGSMYIVYE